MFTTELLSFTVFFLFWPVFLCILLLEAHVESGGHHNQEKCLPAAVINEECGGALAALSHLPQVAAR